MQYIEKLKPFVIMSLCTDQDSHVLDIAGLTQRKKLVGCYFNKSLNEKVIENAWLIPLNSLDDRTLDKVIDLAKRYDQNSVLISDENRECQLLSLVNGQTEYVGKMVMVSQNEAEMKGNYSIDTETGSYFITKLLN